MHWFRRRRRSQREADNAPQQQRFHWRAGRRFSNESLYLLPNDAGEWNRIDFQHYLLRSVLHSNYAAPLQQPHSILDAGCAAGRWAMEMADAFPQARVLGIDIVIPSAAEGAAPETRPHPQNYRFMEGSILNPLPFGDASFDYVHQRLLYGSMPVPKWPAVVAEYARVTTPGGWVELVEGGIMQNGGPHIGQINDWLIMASQRQNVDILLGGEIGAFLRDAGLQGVTQRTIDVPIGPHGGRVGRMMAINTLAFIDGLRGFIVGQGLASVAAYDAASAGCREEIEYGASTYPYYVAYGQRR